MASSWRFFSRICRVSELRSTQTRRRSSSPVAPLMVSVPSRSMLAGPRILFSFTAMRIRQSVDGMGNQMPRLVCRSLEAKRISCPSG